MAFDTASPNAQSLTSTPSSSTIYCVVIGSIPQWAFIAAPGGSQKPLEVDSGDQTGGIKRPAGGDGQFGERDAAGGVGDAGGAAELDWQQQHPEATGGTVYGR